MVKKRSTKSYKKRVKKIRKLDYKNIIYMIFFAVLILFLAFMFNFTETPLVGKVADASKPNPQTKIESVLPINVIIDKDDIVNEKADADFTDNINKYKIKLDQIKGGDIGDIIIEKLPEPCGNGVLDSGEVCDGGNKIDNDDCSNECKLNL